MTYNLWQLPLVSQDRKVRLEKLIPRIQELQPDILAFQELWTRTYKKRLAQDLKELGYQVYFESPSSGLGLKGLLGNGLFIASRYPMRIPSEHLLAFREYTAPEEIMAAKGALHVEVELPNIGWSDLYNTHLGAVRYDKKAGIFNEKDAQANMEQGIELAHWIKNTAAHPFQILSGDFNVHHQSFDSRSGQFSDSPSPLHQLFTQGILSFADVFHLLNGWENSERSYSRDNAYVAKGLFANDPDCFFDFVYASPHPQVNPLSAKLILKEDLPETKRPLSDHYALLVDFDVRNP